MINPLAVLNFSPALWHNLSRDFRLTPAHVLTYWLAMPLLPVVAWYVGLTRVGWQVGISSVVKLTEASGLVTGLVMYAGMVSLVGVVGCTMVWMSKTYGCRMGLTKAVAFSSFVATPFFITGLSGFYPFFWLDVSLLLLAITWSLFILYSRMPSVSGISEERAFMFSSAVVAAGGIAFIFIVVLSILMWGLIAPPVFTD